MEHSTRAPTLNDLKEKVIFWSLQVRMTEKAILDAPVGKKDAAKRRLYHVRMKFNEAVDIYQGKMP